MPKNTYTLDLTSEAKFAKSFEELSKTLDIEPSDLVPQKSLLKMGIPADIMAATTFAISIPSIPAALIKSFYERITKHNEEASIEHQIELAKRFIDIARSKGARHIKLILHKKAGLKLATSIAGTDLEVSKSLERDKTIEIDVEF